MRFIRVPGRPSYCFRQSVNDNQGPAICGMITGRMVFGPPSTSCEHGPHTKRSSPVGPYLHHAPLDWNALYTAKPTRQAFFTALSKVNMKPATVRPPKSNLHCPFVARRRIENTCLDMFLTAKYCHFPSSRSLEN
jgi:hypothetical protein